MTDEAKPPGYWVEIEGVAYALRRMDDGEGAVVGLAAQSARLAWRNFVIEDLLPAVEAARELELAAGVIQHTLAEIALAEWMAGMKAEPSPEFIAEAQRRRAVRDEHAPRMELALALFASSGPLGEKRDRLFAQLHGAANRSLARVLAGIDGQPVTMTEEQIAGLSPHVRSELARVVHAMRLE